MHVFQAFNPDSWFMVNMEEVLKQTFLTHISTSNIITMTSYWARWRLKLPAPRLFIELFIQAPIKEKPKLRVTGLLAKSQ